MPRVRLTAKEKKELCANQPDCWEDAKTRGMCGACYSASRTVNKRSSKWLHDRMRWALRLRHRYINALNAK